MHADYLAGAYKTADSALRAAGLKKERTSLHELKNAWRKATAAEQDDFKRHIGCMPGVIASAPPTPPRVFSVDGRPEPWVLERHDEIMIAKRMKISDRRHALGYGALDASLGRAISQGSRLQPKILEALEKWIDDNKDVKALP